MKSYAAFISHTSSEAKLAICLKDWIESTFSDHISVFVSSDRRDIRAGDKWFKEIDGALNAAKVQLVICSPYSITRPWIHFESGSAWIRQIPVIPVCHSGITKDNVPSPLSTFQGLTLIKGFSELLLDALARHFGIAKLPRIAFEQMDAELLKAASDALPQIHVEAPSSTNSASSETLTEVQVNILKLLSNIDDGQSIDANSVADLIGIPITELRYIADKLERAGYIRSRIITGGGRPLRMSAYMMAEKGRIYLVQNDLV